MAQHVGVHIDAKNGFDAGALDHAPEAGRRQWYATQSAGQGADLLEKRGWDDRPDEVSFASYSAWGPCENGSDLTKLKFGESETAVSVQQRGSARRTST